MGPRGVIHLDTHVAVWLYTQDEARVPPVVRRRLDREDLVVAPMVVLEMEYLHEIGRLTDPPAAVMASLAAGAGLQVSQVSFAACVDAALGLTWTRDPFDRLIVGAAVAERAVLVTADRILREHHPGCVWTRRPRGPTVRDAGRVPSTTPTPATGPAAPAAGQPLAPRRLVIGHRGAPGYRPEHTLASYALAARMGADHVEPDLVPTRDGVLVVRHDNDITSTTDVADHPELADRRTTKTVDGVVLTAWFTEDLTLAELTTLRAKERLPALRRGSASHDGLYRVPTFDEVLALRARLSEELGREIGVYPEAKHPTYFGSIGLCPVEPLLACLAAAGLDGADAPVFVQSFEPSLLRTLHDGGVKVPLVQLLSATGAPYDAVPAGSPITWADAVTPEGLASIATYAAAIAPDKNQVIPRTADDTLAAPTSLVADAHAAGLQVHAYTFRDEDQFLPADLRSGDGRSGSLHGHGRALEEQRLFWATGIDAMFTDQADTAVVSRGVAEEAEQG